MVILALANTGSADNNPVPLTITLEKGIKAQNTSYITQDILSRTINLPSPLHLEIVDIKTGFENNEARIRVITSQTLDKESLTAGFNINPVLTAQTAITENGFTIAADFNETDTYALLLNKNLKGILGPLLENEVSRDLFFGKMPSAISFANKKALYLTPKGSRNIGVQIVNVPEVQVRISKLYANNIMSYVRTNRWRDYAYVDDDWRPTGAFQYGDDSESDYSDVIVDKTVETENLPVSKNISALNIALPEDNQRTWYLSRFCKVEGGGLPRGFQAGFNLRYWPHCQTREKMKSGYLPIPLKTMNRWPISKLHLSAPITRPFILSTPIATA